ncbi:MAG: ABC transporter ATP-binding protein [Coriobacteriales bacterium]|jgi:sulfonate transport system ATP-binding protein|nr:ABC transporter ATP-binding protein [Coriobacteriales bacterium]
MVATRRSLTDKSAVLSVAPPSLAHSAPPIAAPHHHLVACDIVRVYTDADDNEVLALDGFDLEIEGSEIVGLIGPSGCGKSTFLRLVAGLDQQQEGVLTYNSTPITRPDYRRGLVFQNAALFEWLTVYDNIAYGLRARKVFRQQKEKVQAYIDLMGLTGFEKSYPHQISGGMASRTALARSFIQEPGVILLDEPLASLDAFTRATIQDQIIEMQQRARAIIILVTHDIEEAVYLCDRIVIMSSRPGRAVGEVAIGLDHPRDRTSPAFIEYRRAVMQVLGEGQ